MDDGHVFSSLDIHNSHEYVNEENSLDMTPDIQNLKSKHVECTKTQLLLSTEQFLKEDIPVPGYNDSFCFSKDTYGHVTDESPLFAIDCEFVKCRDGNTFYFAPFRSSTFKRVRSVIKSYCFILRFQRFGACSGC